MAYLAKEKVSEIRNNLKKEFPTKEGWKFSVRNEHSSSLHVAILKSPIDILGSSKKLHLKTIIDAIYSKQDYKYNHFDLDSFLATKYDNLNHYYLENELDGEALKVAEKIYSICMDGNHDNSDSQSDYFDVGWYFNLKVGDYEKPFVFTGSNEVDLSDEIAEYKKITDYKEPSDELPTEDIEVISEDGISISGVSISGSGDSTEISEDSDSNESFIEPTMEPEKESTESGDSDELTNELEDVSSMDAFVDELIENSKELIKDEIAKENEFSIKTIQDIIDNSDKIEDLETMMAKLTEIVIKAKKIKTVLSENESIVLNDLTANGSELNYNLKIN